MKKLQNFDTLGDRIGDHRRLNKEQLYKQQVVRASNQPRGFERMQFMQIKIGLQTRHTICEETATTARQLAYYCIRPAVTQCRRGSPKTVDSPNHFVAVKAEGGKREQSEREMRV